MSNQAKGFVFGIVVGVAAYHAYSTAQGRGGS